jgi:predicted outer membrane protein
MLAFALALTACGSAAASQPATAPLVEDRSYDRVEEIRAARLTAVVSVSDRNGEFHRLAEAATPWSRH